MILRDDIHGFNELCHRPVEDVLVPIGEDHFLRYVEDEAEAREGVEQERPDRVVPLEVRSKKHQTSEVRARNFGLVTRKVLFVQGSDESFLPLVTELGIEIAIIILDDAMDVHRNRQKYLGRCHGCP